MSFGRGGAGNISFAEATEQEQNHGSVRYDDPEANVRPKTAYTVSIMGGQQINEKDDEYIHTGRGGSGNVISQVQSGQRKNSNGYAIETSIASTAAEMDPSDMTSPDGSSSPGIVGGSQLKYLGRGGAGNFVSTWENSSGADMEMQQRRESEVKEKVAADVEKGLSKPDKIHDPYR